MNIIKRLRVACCLVFAGLLLPFGAAAEVADGVGEIEEVLVTAQRRVQDIQDISGVVQSLSGEALRNDAILQFRDLQQAVPGLSIANQEGNVEIFIRGVGSANNTELGDPGAAPHLNGVYIPRPRGLGGMFYDVERVEVNKGPQGTLYGRNALAGTLNIITKKPDYETVSGYFQGDATNRDGFGAEAALNIPLNERNAIRLAGFLMERDFGFSNTGDPDLDPAGLQRDYGARLSYSTEFNDTTSLLVVADFGVETGTGYPGANIHSAVTTSGLRAEDLDLRDVRYRGPEGDLDNEIFGVQVLFAKSFEHFDIEWNTSYREVDFEQVNASSDGIDAPGRAASDLDVFSTNFWLTESEALISELRISSNGDGDLSWSAGVFGFQEDQKAYLHANADRGFCCFSGLEFNFPDVEGDAFAAYGDVTYSFTENLRGIVGLRYTDESKSRSGIGGNWALVLGGDGFACCVATRLGTEGYAPAGFGRPDVDLDAIASFTLQQQAQFLVDGIASVGARYTLVAQIQGIADGTDPGGNCFTRPDIDNGFITCPANGDFSFISLTTPSRQVGEADFDYVDWRIGLEYDLSENHLLYGKFSSGHKAGGFNDNFAGAQLPEDFEPEDVLVFEVGSRLRFFVGDRPQVFNATAFYYDYNDQVLQDLTCINFDSAMNMCNGFALANRNIGESEIMGLELEGQFSLPGRFNLDVNLSWLDSEITEGAVADVRAQDFSMGGQTPIIDLSGNRLALQSDLEVALRLSHDFDIGNINIDWQILAKYRSDFFLSQFNERDVIFLSGNTQTALQAGFPDEQEASLVINAGLGINFPNDMRLEAFLQNATDEEISQKAITGSGTNLRFLNDARTYGARFVVRF